ncbi:unnamed protein product [Brassica oleracea var. botrytis]|uniref:F-box associated beta-propeller type 1 domain-containing protein n=1 Tax=Brassica oleracea TaxID=3712 RepID=A0A3P6FZ90_BRAOL|nr:unnamed protein product [Brassica oleracea]
MLVVRAGDGSLTRAASLPPFSSPISLRSHGSILPNIALWNPLLNKLRWVEQAAGCITSSDYYGIGYNNGDGNYKLLRFTCRPFEVEGFENVPEVEIYEFETSSWRTVGGKVDVDVEITRRCVSVMGNMYWVAYRCWKEGEKFIRVFDFSDETSRTYASVLPLMVIIVTYLVSMEIACRCCSKTNRQGRLRCGFRASWVMVMSRLASISVCPVLIFRRYRSMMISIIWRILCTAL